MRPTDFATTRPAGRDAGPASAAAITSARALPTAWTTRETLTACLCVIAFWAAAAAAWPILGQVVPWDSKNQFYPMLRYLGASLANGEWPLWNPYHFSGHPAVADPQSLLFTPSMLLFGWLVPQPSLELFDVVIFAHLLPGALGIIGLFRRRRWHWLGAVIAAMVFVLGGSASGRLQHTGMIVSYGFFPLALLLLEEALARRSYLFGLGFALVAIMMAIGRDQVAFLCCLTLIGTVVYQTLSAERPLAYLRDRALLLGFIGLIGSALLAVPALLTMQFLSDSNRPAFDLEVAAMGSLPPSSLATMLFSNIFGSLRHTYDYWGASNGAVDRTSNYLFAGTLSGLLLLWHGIAGGRLFAREFRFFLIIGIVALIYALGSYTPIYTAGFGVVPGLDLYRRPADATFLFNISFAFATGYLVHRYLRDGLPRLNMRGGAPLPLMLGLAAIVLVISALAVGMSYATAARQLPAALAEVSFGVGVALVLIATLVFGFRRPRLRALAACGLVAFTAAELIGRNAASAMNAEPEQRYAVFENIPAEQLAGLKVLKDELDMRHARGERPRVEILGLNGPWQNASMVFGLEDTLGYNPLRISDYERAVGPGENSEDASLRQFPATFSGYRCRLASLLGLEYLVLNKPIEKMPHRFPVLSNTRLLYGAGSMWIYKMPPTMPRAYLASKLVPVDSESVLDGEELPDFDHGGAALIEEGETDVLKGDYGLRDQTTAPTPAHGHVIIRGYRRNAIVIDVETDRSAILVLHDIYYPGWEVSVDGEDKKVLRTNLLFRGVEIPPGKHRVRFEFKPLSVHNLVAAASELVSGGEHDDEAENTGAALQTPRPPQGTNATVMR